MIYHTGHCTVYVPSLPCTCSGPFLFLLFNLHFPVPLASSSAFCSYQRSAFPHLLCCLPGTFSTSFLFLEFLRMFRRGDHHAFVSPWVFWRHGLIDAWLVSLHLTFMYVYYSPHLTILFVPSPSTPLWENITLPVLFFLVFQFLVHNCRSV